MNKREIEINKDLRKMILLKKLCQNTTMNTRERIRTLEFIKEVLNTYADIIDKEILQQSRNENITILPSNCNKVRLHFKQKNYTIELKKYLQL